jgi:uncharacterized protein YacL
MERGSTRIMDTIKNTLGFILGGIIAVFVVFSWAAKAILKLIASFIKAIFLNFYGRVVALGGLALYAVFLSNFILK